MAWATRAAGACSSGNALKSAVLGTSRFLIWRMMLAICDRGAATMRAFWRGSGHSATDDGWLSVSAWYTARMPAWLACCRGAARIGAVPVAVTMTRWYSAVRIMA